jgi:hypothetical protein
MSHEQLGRIVQRRANRHDLAGFKSAKTIDDPVLEVGRFQLLSYGFYNVDGAATVVRDG